MSRCGLNFIAATSRPALSWLLSAALVAGSITLDAHAAGDDKAEPTCRKGLVWDKKKQMCVPAQSGVISDDALADYAYALAEQERYEEALDVLDLAADGNSAKILNYRGYATRKLGRVEEGIGYYRQALAIDPENVLVRSYLGEAYLTKGDIAAARKLLEEIRDRCGMECREYVNLAAAIRTNNSW